jgi:hypothetical protein
VRKKKIQFTAQDVCWALYKTHPDKFAGFESGQTITVDLVVYDNGLVELVVV